MARKKKSVLNQKVKEPKQEIKTETPVEEPKIVKHEGLVYGEDYVENPDVKRTLVEKTPSEFTPEPEISLKVSGEKLAEALKEKETVPAEVVEEDEKEEVVGEKPRPLGVRDFNKDKLKTLSKRDLRFLQRTGKLPN